MTSPLASVLTALKDLADAEKAYHTARDAHGDSDIRTSRARAALRQAAARGRILDRAHATPVKEEA